MPKGGPLGNLQEPMTVVLDEVVLSGGLSHWWPRVSLVNGGGILQALISLSEVHVLSNRVT